MATHFKSLIYQVQLEDDMIVAKHLTTLYSNMLEHNLCRYHAVCIKIKAGNLKLRMDQLSKY